jgi:hypothetical protein
MADSTTTQCPECNCNDSQDVVALKQQAADLKAKVLARQSDLLGQIDALKLKLATLQAQNTESLKPREDICGTGASGTMTPQSLNANKTYRFGSKCGGN